MDTRGLPAELALWREMPVILQHANKTQRNSGARPCPYRTCASRVFFLSDSHSRIVPVVKKGKRSEEVERKGRLTRDVAVVPPHLLHTALLCVRVWRVCAECARTAGQRTAGIHSARRAGSAPARPGAAVRPGPGPQQRAPWALKGRRALLRV